MTGFNSTLVRLEGEPRSRIFFKRFGFNSTLVRLEVRRPRQASIAHPRFNSTLVRLEELTARFLSSIRTRFNSTLVRLEAAVKVEAQAAANTGFNSTLVRLEVFRIVRHFVLLPAFQFHSGSIRSPAGMKAPHTEETVSIPLWFD